MMTLEKQLERVQKFDFRGASVRTVMIKGEPWFVAADVCAILEIGKARDAVSSLPQKGAATTGAGTYPGRVLIPA
jgi:prophage antirepressor-like protein